MRQIFKASNYKEIRDVIIKKKRSTPPEDLVIVLKPNEEATYKNTVDMLDEMTINQVKRFALVDISEVENGLIMLLKVRLCLRQRLLLQLRRQLLVNNFFQACEILQIAHLIRNILWKQIKF